jgi:hypothetical protein
MNKVVSKDENVEMPTPKLGGIRTIPIELKVAPPTELKPIDEKTPVDIEDDEEEDDYDHERKKGRVEAPAQYDKWHVLSGGQNHYFF